MVVNPLHSAIAGMAVHAAKMAVHAHNVANVNTDEFKRSEAVIESNPGGPSITVTESTSPGPVVSEPEGLPGGPVSRELSNVNLPEEMVQMVIAKHGYMASAQVILTQSETLGSLIDIIA